MEDKAVTDDESGDDKDNELVRVKWLKVKETDLHEAGEVNGEVDSRDR